TSRPAPAAGRRRPGQRSGGKVRDTAPAADRPVAKVAVDIPLAHLDRPFDYLVPERMAADAEPGCRVRVRFSGKLVDGFVLDRMASSDHPGRLSYLDRVVSAEPVLTPEIAGLARAVADRYAGTLADVLRLGGSAPGAAPDGTPARAHADMCVPAPGRPPGPARAPFMGPLPGRGGIPGRDGRRARRPGGLVRAARPGVAGRGRGGRGGRGGGGGGRGR